MQIRRRMSHKPITIGSDKTVIDALEIMKKSSIRHLPVVDGKKFVGFVSEFDLLTALRKGKKLNEVTAGEIMTANPVSVTQDTNVMTLIDVLQNNHLIRVPVVDSTGKLIGIVARRDLLRSYLHAMA